MTISEKSLGISLVVVSALVFSSAGLFTKGVVAGSWDVIFWRGIFAALLTTIFVMLRGSVSREFSQVGRWGWAVALLGASGTAAFIPAFKFTSIANVSMIYAIAPLLAALFAFVWFRERLSKQATLGSVLAFVGVAIIVSGSIGDATNFLGDLLALWMAVAIAAMLAVYRKHPDTPAAGPAVYSSIILLPFSLYFSNPLEVPMGEIFILAGFGVVFAVASVTLAEGAKRLPSGETALLSTLEAPFAPVLAWLVLAHVPGVISLIGGGLILLGVVYSQWPKGSA